MANLTPMMWYSKKQATSETATYGAEFLAARTCMEQIVDLRNLFRYLGVPVYKTSYMWGDNESQIHSSSVPYARLGKRHNILSFHYVRSLIAREFVILSHIPSAFNVADTLSKHWGHQSNYHNLIRPLLNYHERKSNVSSCEVLYTSNDYRFVRTAQDGE